LLNHNSLLFRTAYSSSKQSDHFHWQVMETYFSTSPSNGPFPHFLLREKMTQGRKGSPGLSVGP
jgi:hypothetical protein